MVGGNRFSQAVNRRLIGVVADSSFASQISVVAETSVRTRPPKSRDVKTSRSASVPLSQDRTKRTDKTNKGGRPSDYRIEYADLAKKFFLLKQEAKDSDLAAFLDVAESTIHLWKKQHPEFSESIQEGKERANANVAFSLYNRAVGYDITVQKVVNGELKDCKEHVPGDVQAQRLFLSNRTQWRDKQQMEHSGVDGKPIQVEDASAGDIEQELIRRGAIKKNGHAQRQ